jgi:hypothetical protein
LLLLLLLLLALIFSLLQLLLEVSCMVGVAAGRWAGACCLPLLAQVWRRDLQPCGLGQLQGVCG